MAWEIANNLVFVGLAFFSLVMALLIDKIQIGKNKVDLPIGQIFIVLALLFSMQALEANMLVIQANSIAINNTTISDGLTGASRTGFTIMMLVFYLYMVVTIIRFLIALVEGLLMNRGLKEPKI